MAVKLSWDIDYSYTNTARKWTIKLYCTSTSGTWWGDKKSGYIACETSNGNLEKKTFSSTMSANTKKLIASTSFTSARTTSDWTCTIKAGFHKCDTISTTGTIAALDKFTITFNGNGGSTSTKSVFYGHTTTFPTSAGSKTGYTLKNWNTNSSGTGNSYSLGGNTPTVTSAKTYYAQWTQNKYTINYNPNTGDGSISSQSVGYKDSITLSNGSGFTKDKYKLVSWNTSPDGSGSKYELSEIINSYTHTNNLTLYAIWELDVVPINFNFLSVDGKTDTTITQYLTIGAQTLPNIAIDIDGYTFTGYWTTDSIRYIDLYDELPTDIAINGVNTYNIEATDNPTFYAIYKKSTYPNIERYISSLSFYRTNTQLDFQTYQNKVKNKGTFESEDDGSFGYAYFCIKGQLTGQSGNLIKLHDRAGLDIVQKSLLYYEVPTVTLTTSTGEEVDIPSDDIVLSLTTSGSTFYQWIFVQMSNLKSGLGYTLSLSNTNGLYDVYHKYIATGFSISTNATYYIADINSNGSILTFGGLSEDKSLDCDKKYVKYNIPIKIGTSTNYFTINYIDNSYIEDTKIDLLNLSQGLYYFPYIYNNTTLTYHIGTFEYNGSNNGYPVEIITDCLAQITRYTKSESEYELSLNLYQFNFSGTLTSQIPIYSLTAVLNSDDIGQSLTIIPKLQFIYNNDKTTMSLYINTTSEE